MIPLLLVHSETHYSLLLLQVHPTEEDTVDVTQNDANHDSTRDTSSAATKANSTKDITVAPTTHNGLHPGEERLPVEDGVHPCLLTPTARKVLKAIKFGYPSMLSIGSLALLGLILYGVLRPVCVDKVSAM